MVSAPTLGSAILMDYNTIQKLPPFWRVGVGREEGRSNRRAALDFLTHAKVCKLCEPCKYSVGF